MIEVDVGGTIVEFPDGTPKDVMRSALQRKFGQQPQAPQAQPQAGDYIRKAIEPITSLPETYNQFRQESQRQMAQGADQLSRAWSGEDMMGYPVENRAWEAAKGVGNTALGALGYVTSPINAGIRTIVSKPVEDVTGVPKELTDFAASFALPVPGAQARSMVGLESTLTRMPRTLTAGERVAEAGQNLAGVGTSGPVNVPRAVASDSMSMQRAAATVGNVPIAGNPLVEAAGNTTKQLAAKSQEIAQEYGSASTITAGDSAATSIKNWITGTSKKNVSDAYNKVDSLVDNSIKTDLTQTRAAADTILARRANANIAEKSDAVRRIEEAVTNPDGLNYNGVKDLRTYIGELLDGKKMLPADLRESELKQIYTGLSKDLRTTVENAGGPRALGAFERANKYNALVSDRREALAKIVGADGEAPAAQVFDRLIGMAGNTTRADMSKLAQARKAMGPESWNEVASGLISQMGRVHDATGNVIFSPQTFLTSYQTKLSPAGRELLFRSAGKENLAPFLNDIATISTRFKELQKFSNPSGTAQNSAGVLGGVGLIADPLTTISAVVGGNTLARILATPATVAPAAQWARKYSIVVQSPSPANVAQLTIASRNLANSVNSNLGGSVQWQELLKETQGGVKARADGEQPKPEGVVNQ